MTVLSLVMLVFRWLHVLAAITLMGGSIFMRFALLPVAAGLPPDAHQQLRGGIRARWSRFVMAAIGFLLLSGVVNYVLTSRQYILPVYYHLLFGVKFGLGLVIFCFASLLVGRSAMADKVRSRAAFWLSLNLLLATVVVCIGGVMRFTERVPKAARLSGLPPVAKGHADRRPNDTPSVAAGLRDEESST